MLQNVVSLGGKSVHLKNLGRLLQIKSKQSNNA